MTNLGRELPVWRIPIDDPEPAAAGLRVLDAFATPRGTLAAVQSGGPEPRAGSRFLTADAGDVWEVRGVAFVPAESHAAGRRGLSLAPVGHEHALRPGDRLVAADGRDQFSPLVERMLRLLYDIENEPEWFLEDLERAQSAAALVPPEERGSALAAAMSERSLRWIAEGAARVMSAYLTLAPRDLSPEHREALAILLRPLAEHHRATA